MALRPGAFPTPAGDSTTPRDRDFDRDYVSERERANDLDMLKILFENGLI